MIETRRYTSKPREVDAVQVSANNMAAIADWVNGPILDDPDTNSKYVEVEVHNPMNDRQKQAFIGDWILYSTAGVKPSFKVFTNKAFRRNFDQVSDATILHGRQAAEEPLDPEMQKLMGLDVTSGPESSAVEIPANELVPVDSEVEPVQDSLPSGKSTDDLLREQVELAQSHQS